MLIFGSSVLISKVTFHAPSFLPAAIDNVDMEKEGCSIDGMSALPFVFPREGTSEYKFYADAATR
jgi:hypothetical protein